MAGSKERVTVTVDRDLIRAAQRAVAAGRAGSVSGWVNEALTERAARDRRLQALGEAVAAFEAEHGEIATAELEAQARADRRSARRGEPVARRGRKRGRRRAA